MAETSHPLLDRDHGTKLVLVTWTLFAISTVLIIGREISKHFILRRLGLDDLLMLLAWCCTAVYSITMQQSYRYGLGRHFEFLTLKEDLAALRWMYVGQGFCIFSLVLGRSSFNLYLLSIMGKSRRLLRILLWAFLAAGVALNVALIAALYGKCGADLLTIIYPTTTCYRPGALLRFSQFVGAFNVVTDGILTIAPVALISSLKTTPRAKVGAIALLGLSSFAMGAAIWRTNEIAIIFSGNFDFTWLIIPYFLASSLEQNVIIITASVPTLGPIVKHLGRKWNGRRSNTPILGSSRKDSGESDELYHNLALALGMHVPHLGNHVTIVAGSQARDSDEERILPMRNLSTIKTTTKTTVLVESGDSLTPMHTR